MDSKYRYNSLAPNTSDSNQNETKLNNFCIKLICKILKQYKLDDNINAEAFKSLLINKVLQRTYDNSCLLNNNGKHKISDLRNFITFLEKKKYTNYNDLRTDIETSVYKVGTTYAILLYFASGIQNKRAFLTNIVRSFRKIQKYEDIFYRLYQRNHHLELELVRGSDLYYSPKKDNQS